MSDTAPPELSIAAILDPVTLDALDTVRRRQLEISGRLYSSIELSAEEMLDPKYNDGCDEKGDPMIAPNCLELRTISRDGKPAYDAWLYNVDSGTIFKAGTTDVVAEVIQFGVETDDPVLEQALEPVLRGDAKRRFQKESAGASGPRSTSKPKAAKRAAKKPAPKKRAAKKRSAKKRAAKKPTKQQTTRAQPKAKRPTSKRVSKKRVSKKRPASKQPPKKRPAKKRASKGLPARKRPAKKRVNKPPTKKKSRR